MGRFSPGLLFFAPFFVVLLAVAALPAWKDDAVLADHEVRIQRVGDDTRVDDDVARVTMISSPLADQRVGDDTRVDGVAHATRISSPLALHDSDCNATARGGAIVTVGPRGPRRARLVALAPLLDGARVRRAARARAAAVPLRAHHVRHHRSAPRRRAVLLLRQSCGTSHWCGSALPPCASLLVALVAYAYVTARRRDGGL